MSQGIGFSWRGYMLKVYPGYCLLYCGINCNICFRALWLCSFLRSICINAGTSLHSSRLKSTRAAVKMASVFDNWSSRKLSLRKQYGKVLQWQTESLFLVIGSVRIRKHGRSQLGHFTWKRLHTVVFRSVYLISLKDTNCFVTLVWSSGIATFAIWFFLVVFLVNAYINNGSTC